MEIIFEEFEEYFFCSLRANKRLRCETWVEKNNRRLRSGYECCCCCCCCCVCALCSTTVMRRLSHDAMCVERAMRCACGAVTRPRAQSTITFFAYRSRLQQKQTQHSTPEHPREHAAVVHKTHGSVIDVPSAPTLPRLRRMTLPDFGGLALAWPRSTGHAFGGVRVVALCGANHRSCDVRIYVT